MCLWNPGIIVHWEHGFPTKANIHNRFKIFFFLPISKWQKVVHSIEKEQDRTDCSYHRYSTSTYLSKKKWGIEPVPVILSGKWLHIL